MQTKQLTNTATTTTKKKKKTSETILNQLKYVKQVKKYYLWGYCVVLWEKGRDRTQSYGKSRKLTPTEKSKKQRYNTKKNLDYTIIVDRLRTISWSNDSHPTGVVKPVNGVTTFPLTTEAV